MRHLTSKAERAAMVPGPVLRVLEALNMRPGYKVDARVAGGAVRDALLGVEPKDWDVATILLPPVTIAIAERMGWPVRFNENSLAHGTVTVTVCGMDVEVTTLRLDVETDGRHAEVEFTTDWREDASRRDLTFNAMFMDPDGEVLDFFDGMQDLLDGRVRFVGKASERLQEDFLRILRFFRFAGRMACEHLDPCALRAIGRHANSLHKISGERVWMEMSKILVGNLSGEMLESMKAHNVLSALGMKNPDPHAAFSAAAMGGRPETVLAALVDNEHELHEVADRFKLSRKEREMAQHVAHANKFVHHRHPKNWDEVQWMKHAVVHGRDHAMELLCLTSKLGFRDDVMANLELPVFPVTGADVLATGMEPGPEVGQALSRMKAAWLDSEFSMDKDALLAML